MNEMKMDKDSQVLAYKFRNTWKRVGSYKSNHRTLYSKDWNYEPQTSKILSYNT